MGPVLSFVGAIFFGVGAGASALYALAVNVARIGLLSLASKLLAPKIDLQQTASNKLLTFKSAIAPQGFVYGEDMITGPLLFAQVTGENNEFLHRVVALTGREIDSIEALRFDDTDISIGASPAELSALGNTITGGKYNGVVYVDGRLGTSTQTVFAQLNTDEGTLWTSAHRGRGWSMIYTKMTNDPANTDAFKTGAPQNLRALVRGHKVYDPRLDSTRVIDSSTSPDTTGTGTHRHNDPSTWAWSDNPALCLADWLTWDVVGAGEPDTRIDWELVAAAADVCEEQVVIPPASSPDITQNRYTCNLTFFADQQRGSIKQILEESMLGRSVFSQGKWRMWAGDVMTSTVNLTEANLAGKIQVEAGTPSKQRYNKVVGKFIDPSRNYQATAYPEQANATYATDDGGEKVRTFDFNACNDTYEAQRNAIIKLRQSRAMNIVVFEGNWSCFQVQPGTVVTVDFDPLSWVGVKFFVTEWELRQDGTGVNLTMVEELDTVWTDPAVGDYTTRTPTGELVPPGDRAVKLTGATLHNDRGAGTCHAGLRLASDGKVLYQSADSSYSDARAPRDEWRRRGADYEFRATLNSGGPLDVGNVGTWEADSADRSYSVQSSNGSKAANITIEITDDSTASPINVITEGTFDLQATVPSSQIELVGVGTVHNTQIDGVNSNNLVMPAGLQTDDVIFVVIFTATATDDYATPTGWNEISYDPTNLYVQCFTRVYGKATGSDDFAMDGTYTSNRNRVYVPFAFRDNSGTQSATETLGTQQGNTGVNAGTDGVASWGFFGMTAGTPLTEEHLILSVNHRSDISSPPTSGFSVNDHEISELQTVAKGGDYYASPADHAQWWLISWMRQSTGAEIGTPAVEDDLVYAPTSTFAWEFSKLFRLQYGSDPS